MLDNVNTKILIAEDNKHTQELLVSILQRDGYDIVGTASDGREAIEKFDILSPDIITMDLDMPIVNGLQATESIMTKNPGAKIVVISGFSEIEKKALELGAVAFIAKPFDPIHLLDVIGSVARQESLPKLNQKEESLNLLYDIPEGKVEKTQEEESLFFFTETLPADGLEEEASETHPTELTINDSSLIEEFNIFDEQEDLFLTEEPKEKISVPTTTEDDSLIDLFRTDDVGELDEEFVVFRERDELFLAEETKEEDTVLTAAENESRGEVRTEEVEDDDDEDDLLSGKPVNKDEKKERQVTPLVETIHEEPNKEFFQIEEKTNEGFFEIQTETKIVEPVYIQPTPYVAEEPLIIKPPKMVEVVEAGTSDYFEIEAWTEPEKKVGLLGKLFNKNKKKRGKKK